MVVERILRARSLIPFHGIAYLRVTTNFLWTKVWIQW